MTKQYSSGGLTRSSNKPTNSGTGLTLTSSAYSGTDTHIHSIWRVYSDAGRATEVYTSGASLDLTSHTASGLAAETTYWWDVSHVGIDSISPESDLTSFTTDAALSSLFGVTLGTGNGGTQQYITGKDYVARDGLVWGKNRTNAGAGHQLTDTVQGATFKLESNATFAQTSSTTFLSQFNVDGFDVGISLLFNESGANFVFWEFLEATGIFDIVAYTGDGIAGRTVAIDLDDGAGSEFGMSIVKNLDTGGNWAVQHRSLGGTQHLTMATAAAVSGINPWNNTAATTTTLTVGTWDTINKLNDRFISYNFAHNPAKGRFAGSYVGTGAAGNKQVVGFRIEWILVRKYNVDNNWYIFDYKRGTTVLFDNWLQPDLASSESSTAAGINVSDDGFSFILNSWNQAGADYLYYAIGTDL